MAQKEFNNQERSTSPSSTTQGGGGGSATQRSMSSPQSAPDRDNKVSAKGNGAHSTDKSLMGQVRETAAGAYGTATTKATEKLEEQKGSLTSGLTSVADSIRKFSRNVGEEGPDSGLSKSAATYGDTAADKLEQAAKYFEHHDVEAIYHDVEDLARQNPAIFVGGAFALGFLAARFLKSSNSRSLRGSRSGQVSRGRIGTTGQSSTQAATQKSVTQSRGPQGSGSL